MDTPPTILHHLVDTARAERIPLEPGEVRSSTITPELRRTSGAWCASTGTEPSLAVMR